MGVVRSIFDDSSRLQVDRKRSTLHTVAYSAACCSARLFLNNAAKVFQQTGPFLASLAFAQPLPNMS